jgi:hypothetical protein
VAAADLSLLILHRAGWRVLLAELGADSVSRRPHALTMAGFEVVALAWQLLFVHGIAIGHQR